MKFFMAIDTETPTIEPRFTAEIGWALIAEDGTIVKSYRALPAEVWAAKPTRTGEPTATLSTDTMLEGKYVAYTGESMQAHIKPLKQIAVDFETDFITFRPIIVSAHNAPFDKRTLKRTFEAYGLEEFSPSKRITHDTQRMCTDLLVGMSSSRANKLKIKVVKTPLQTLYEAWCKKAPETRMTKHAHPRPRVNVETVWQFISGNNGFIEAHTAKEDAEIEAQLLKWLIDNYNH